MEALLNDSFILISFIAFFLIGLNVHMARSIGRSQVNWFILTLLFGPIATIMLVLVKASLLSQQLAERTINSGVWLRGSELH